jgi:ribosomal protein S18 acetylase RimI-like enzyme
MSVFPDPIKTCPVRVCRADYADDVHATALIELLDAYSRDPMGGGEPLSAFARHHLVSALASRAQAFSVLAFARIGRTDADLPIGLVNCLEGFSTFACRPLVNIHDLAVLPAWRGKRVAEKMLELVEKIAIERGACKLTLEVLSGNAGAIKLYHRTGFASYQLDPKMGQANCLQKWLR